MPVFLAFAEDGKGDGFCSFKKSFFLEALAVHCTTICGLVKFNTQSSYFCS